MSPPSYAEGVCRGRERPSVAAPHPTMTEEKTFLLGVGAQKSGTSWLFDYLDGHPACRMGFVKEYHVFDALEVPECRHILEGRCAEARGLLESSERLTRSRATVFKLLDFYADVTNYFDYFDHLVHADDAALLTGDITPAYAALSPDVFRHVRDALVARRLRVRVVFLMRDPVERCLSAARMRLKTRGIPLTTDSETEMLRTLYPLRNCEIRTRYDRTIRSLEEVFAPDELYFGFFERLFAAESVRDICGFLWIPYCEPDLGRKVNVSRTANVIPDDVRAEVFREYRDVYSFIDARFGAAATADIWRRY